MYIAIIKFFGGFSLAILIKISEILTLIFEDSWSASLHGSTALDDYDSFISFGFLLVDERT